ncbi:MAG: hypothetical protein IJX98_00795 [Clostridia bacterium]|nr:hypothetical protein [Clostridia bacterium]
MAIAEMRKLRLVAMSYDKDGVLNALQKTGAAEIKLQLNSQGTQSVAVDAEDLSARLSSVEAALASLASEVENYEKDRKLPSSIPADGFDVSYSEFMGAAARREEAETLVKRAAELIDERNALKGELVKIKRERKTAETYACITRPFDAYNRSIYARARLGTVPMAQADALVAKLAEISLCATEVFSTVEGATVVLVVAHKDALAEADGVLSLYSFVDCPYKGEKSGAETAREWRETEESTVALIAQKDEEIYALKEGVRLLKIYADYLAFELEKELSGEKLRRTDATFLLEAYVPLFAVEAVTAELQAVSKAAYFEFTEPTDEDEPPTLLQNNAVVASFEGITNTYSPPNYREFDPNAVMGFFYSVFMGFIIGDAGYGILMALVGGYIWWKNRKRPTGTSKLCGAFAFGGVFAVIWGLLFNSLFGFPVFAESALPNPQTDQWLLAGISVPSVLIISMLIGVVQIFAGYLCCAVQNFRRGQIVDGLCDGILWALFSVGVGFAIVGFTEEFQMGALATVGGAVAGGSLLLAMLTASRKGKGFTRITKAFGAAYGVINYASDILSYARLYGLMLSGAVIASIIATYGGQMIVSGNIVLILIGVILLLAGNAFNLVMNLLGAYIHDARLQYVEFYGRFFEGEGELFRPLGGEHKYISVLPDRETEETAA